MRPCATRLEIIQRNMEQSQSAVNEARARTLRALLRTGAFMGKRVVTDARRAEVIRGLRKLAESRFEELRQRAKGVAGGDDLLAKARESLKAKQAKWDETLAEIESSMANSLSYYGDMTIGVGADYTDAEAETQLPVVEAELQANNNPYLIPYARVFVTHLRAYRRARAVDKTLWRQDLMRIDPASRP